MLKLEHQVKLRVKDIQEALIDFDDAYSHVTFSMGDGKIAVNSFILYLSESYFRNIIRENEEFDRIIIPDFDTRFIEKYVDLISNGEITFHDVYEKLDFFDFFFNTLGHDYEQFSDNVKRLDDRFMTSFKVDRKKPKVCKYCLKELDSKRSRVRHEQVCDRSTNKREVKLQCQDCELDFKTKEGLEAHRIAKHCLKDSFTCLSCPKSYMNLSSLRRHCDIEDHEFPDIDEDSSKQRFPHLWEKCKICKKLIRLPHDYHMKWYHDKELRMNECTKCDYKTMRRDNYLRHLRSVHNLYNFDFDTLNENCASNLIYKCKKCSAKFRSKQEIENHMFLKNCKELKCDRCKKTFTMEQNLKRHMKKFHPNQDLGQTVKSKNLDLGKPKVDSRSSKEGKEIVRPVVDREKKTEKSKSKKPEKINIFEMRKVARQVKTPGDAILDSSSDSEHTD